ncbi:MAG: FAD-linked oxidase C-terminal domain-containing protein [Thermoleophilia bacterium]
MIAQRILDELRTVVGDANILFRRADLQTYEYDAYLEKALPGAVAFVHTTDEVAGVVRVLQREGIPFVPRGCGTNLSGGVLAAGGGVVIEMARMNRILEIDTADQRAVVEPGVYNLDVSTALDPLGYYYAPDPASQKACSIGGNVGENAGGPHCFKYGVTANHVLGVEVVLPDGEVVWFGGRALDTPGFDLTGVMVGSEGTLGIVTKVVLRIMRKPEAVKTMLAVYDSIDDAGDTVSAIVAAGMVPATLEMMDNAVIQAVEDSMAAGYPRDAAAVLILELDGVCDGIDDQAERMMELCRAHRVREVRVAATEEERAALWKGRKGAFGAVSRLAPSYIVADGTVPRTKLPETIRGVREIATRYGLRVANVFHAGDGNLHPLLLFDSRDPGDRELVLAAGMDMLRLCADMGGTVSGEHGIGLEKAEAMLFVFDENDMRAQEWVKEAFDSADLCNPGKVLPSRVERWARAGA